MFTMFKVVSNTYRLPLGARYTGDFSRVGSASDCEPCFRFGTVAQVLMSAVVIATRELTREA